MGGTCSDKKVRRGGGVLKNGGVGLWGALAPLPSRQSAPVSKAFVCNYKLLYYSESAMPK